MVNYKLCVLHYMAIQFVFRFIGMYMYYVHVCTFIMYMCVPVVLCVCSPISMY